MNTENVRNSRLSQTYVERVGILRKAVENRLPSGVPVAVRLALEEGMSLRSKDDPRSRRESDELLKWGREELSRILSDRGRKASESPKRPSLAAPFSFMRKISDACLKLTSFELLVSERPDGKYAFVPDAKTGKARLLPASEPLPKNAVAIAGETVGRRVGAFPAPASSRPPPPRFAKKTPSAPSSRTFPKGPSVAKKLGAEKAAFSEVDRVPKVTSLSVGDRMFISFGGGSECFSITVRQSSKDLPGHSAALCDVSYRVFLPGSREPVSRTCEGLLYLPLSVGNVMRFSDGGRYVPELSRFPVREIRLKKSAGETRH